MKRLFFLCTSPIFFERKGISGVFRKYFEQAWLLAIELKSDNILNKDKIDYIESTCRQ